MKTAKQLLDNNMRILAHNARLKAYHKGKADLAKTMTKKEMAEWNEAEDLALDLYLGTYNFQV